MATAKKKNEQKGPKPYEVIIGAFLSIVLGALLAVGYLVVQPVEEADELPAEATREARTIYFVEGETGSAVEYNWQPKYAAVEAGSSGTISLVEQELNLWVAAAFEDLQEEVVEGFVTIVPRSLNFRIHDGEMQIASELDMSVFGMGREVIAQAYGTFVQRDGRFVFQPNRLYLGGFKVPHDRLAAFMFDQVYAAFDITEELVDGWTRLSDVRLEEDTLILEIP